MTTTKDATLPVETWMTLLERVIAAVEAAPDAVALRRATEILFSRFPQRQPTSLPREFFGRAADVAERMLHLVLQKRVDGETDFSVITALDALCQTARDGEQIVRALSDGTIEPIHPRALYWMAANAEAIATASPKALAWLAEKMPAEGPRHEWYLVRQALGHLPADPEGLRAAAAVLAADARANPKKRRRLIESGDVEPLRQTHSWPITLGSFSADILNDSEETDRLEWAVGGADYELRRVLDRLVENITTDLSLLDALAGTAWPIAFWRRLAERAGVDAPLRERVWPLSLSPVLAAKAATPTAALALQVLKDGGDRADELERVLEKSPDDFRPLLFCIDEGTVKSDTLRQNILKVREGHPRCDPDDLESRIETSIGASEPDPHWFLRSHGVDVAANAACIDLGDKAESFWTAHLNDAPSDAAAGTTRPNLEQLLTASSSEGPSPLRDWMLSHLLRACRSLFLRKGRHREDVDIARRSLQASRRLLEAPIEEFIELAAMLLEKVDTLDDEHRAWLKWGRSSSAEGDVKVSLYFRIFLIALHKFDPDWAWRELLEWLEGEPNDFLLRAMWQFLRVRPHDVVNVAIPTEARWANAKDAKSQLSLGSLLAHAALVDRSPAAIAWLNDAARDVPTLSVHGVLWWMRARAWFAKEPGVRAESRKWVLTAGESARKHRAAEPAQEIVFNVSACLVRELPEERPLSVEEKRELILSWSGLLRLLGPTIALNAYEVWQFLQVVDEWAVVDAAECADVLQMLSAREESGVNGAAVMMLARDVVSTINAIASRAHGDPTVTKSLLALIERLVLTRNPKASALLPLRGELARAVKEADLRGALTERLRLSTDRRDEWLLARRIAMRTLGGAFADAVDRLFLPDLVENQYHLDVDEIARYERTEAERGSWVLREGQSGVNLKAGPRIWLEVAGSGGGFVGSWPSRFLDKGLLSTATLMFGTINGIDPEAPRVEMVCLPPTPATPELRWVEAATQRAVDVSFFTERIAKHLLLPAKPPDDPSTRADVPKVEPGKVYAGLSEHASRLLRAATGDKHGCVIMTESNDGLSVTTADIEFVEPDSPRSAARWRAAVAELKAAGHIRDAGSGEVFDVTDAGYAVVEQAQ
ncbi:MAG: hypothetical protein Q8O67_22535 [Deltaproteobacteria bacterium]|nr:hypothetical protein [Deltaproteobacteria bacterium]